MLNHFRLRGPTAVLGLALTIAAVGLVGATSATAAPVAASTEPDLSSWRVTQTRLGPYRLGQTIAQAQLAGHISWRGRIQAAIDFNAAMSEDGTVACPGDGQVNVPLVKGDWGRFVMGVVSVPCNRTPIPAKQWWTRMDPLHRGRIVGLTMQRMATDDTIVGGREVVRFPETRPGNIRLLDELPTAPALRRLFSKSRMLTEHGWDADFISVFPAGVKLYGPSTRRLQFVVDPSVRMVEAVILRSAPLSNPSWYWQLT